MLKAVSSSGGSGSPSTNTVARTALGVPFNLQIVGTYGRLSSGTWGGAAGGRQDIRFENRSQVKVGGAACSNLRLAFYGGFYHNGASGETATGFSYQIESAFESTSPVFFKRLTISGNELATLGNMAPLYITDDANHSVAANGNIYQRIGVVVGSPSAIFPGGNNGNSGRSGDAFFLSYAPTSQIYATGAISNPTSYGGAAGAGAYPAALLGIPASPLVAAIGLGDSIMAGNNDTADANGNIGYFLKGLYAGNGTSAICNATQAIGSNTAVIETTAGSLKRSLWPYATHVVFALGTNDIAGAGRTATQIQADLTTLCTAAKQTIGPYGKPLHVTLVTLAPRTTSTDSWATTANQTVLAQFGPGGYRETVNTWIKAQAGTALVDDVFDVNTLWEDPANVGKWVVTGAANYATSDGTHPSNAVTTSQATSFATLAAGWIP